MALPAFLHSTTALMIALFGVSLFACGHRQKITRLSIDALTTRRGVNQSQNKMVLKVHEDAIVEEGSVKDAQGNFSGNKNTENATTPPPMMPEPRHPPLELSFDSRSTSNKLTKIREIILSKLISTKDVMDSTSCNKVAVLIWNTISKDALAFRSSRDLMENNPNTLYSLVDRSNNEGIYIVQIAMPQNQGLDYSHFAVVVNMKDEDGAMYAFLMQAYGVDGQKKDLAQWFYGNKKFGWGDAGVTNNDWVHAATLWSEITGQPWVPGNHRAPWVPGFPEAFRTRIARQRGYSVKLSARGTLRDDIWSEPRASVIVSSRKKSDDGPDLMR